MKKVRNIIMGLLLILPFSLNAAPQLVLSFDGGYNGGTSIEETWRDYRHIFEQYPDVKVTFFVGRYTDFYMGTPMVDFLRDMKAAGHRIAMHGTKHLRAEDFVALHGIQGYVKVEILPDLVNLRADGFDIEHFAYGFGSFTRETDVVLSQYFKTLRYVAGGASEYLGMLGAISAPHSLTYHSIRLGQGSLATTWPVLDEAAITGDIVAIHSHKIGYYNDPIHVTPEALVALIDYALDKGFVIKPLGD